MAKIDANIKIIDDALDTFERGTNRVQNKAFDNLIISMSDLDYTAAGVLKPTQKNLKTLAKIKGNLASFLQSNNGHITDFLGNYEALEKVNESYYASIVDDFASPTALKVIKEASIQNIITGLGSSGVNGTVTAEISNILYDAMQGGMSRNDLVSQVRVYMLGDEKTLGHLLRYSKQIADDSINQYDAGIDKSVTDSLKFEWFQYIGGVIDTTRPFCAGLTSQRYIHKSEFERAANGHLRNQSVSKAGMIKGTNGDNLQLYRGGYQCRHKFRGVTSLSVPKSVRERVLGEEK